MNNLNEYIDRYEKEVMVCEIGGEDTEVEDTYNMLKEVIERVREIPQGKGLGVFIGNQKVHLVGVNIN